MEDHQSISELFQLLWQMRKTMQGSIRQVEGLCPQGQFFMLERLHYAIVQWGDGDAIPCRRWRNRPRMLPAAVSRSLRRLEDAGLAERIPDPEDHRRVLVRLTPAGESTRLQAEELLRDYMARVIRGWAAASLPPCCRAGGAGTPPCGRNCPSQPAAPDRRAAFLQQRRNLPPC